MAKREPFSVGAVLARSFSSWIANFIPFTVLAALLYLPIELYTWYVFRDLEEVGLRDLEIWEGVVVLGGLVIRVFLIGTLVYGVFGQLRGQRATMASCVAVGLRRLPAVIGVSILMGLAIFAAAIPTILVAWLMVEAPLIGLLLLIPALFLVLSVACRLWVSIPVAVVEKPGLMASLSRSAELTKGHRGSIFGILFLLGLFERLVSMIIENAFSIDEGSTMADVRNLAWAIVIVVVEMAILQAITSAVIYHDLRLEKEGVGVEELASVFD